MKRNGETEENNRDSGVLSNPLSFVRSGYFYWGDAGPRVRGGDGGYWSLRSARTIYSNYLYFYNTSLDPQYDSYRGLGFAVRSTAPPTLQTEKIVSLSALNSSFHV